MTVGRNMPQTTRYKQRVQIVLVDTSHRRVDARLRDGATIQVNVWEVDPFFRWPQEGELWTIQQESGIWMLGSYMDTADEPSPIENLGAGDARIHAPGVIQVAGGSQPYTIPKKFTQTFGDGVTEAFTFTHGLDTLDIHYAIRTVGQPYTTVAEGTAYSATRTDPDTLALSFNSPPTVNGVTITIIG